jgi:hypothetical protein
MIVATSSPKKWKVGAELIKFYQSTEFSHVLIIQGDLVFQASHGFVNCTHIDNFLCENYIVNYYEVLDDSIDMDFVIRQLGKKYSTLQIIVLPFLKLVKAKSKGNGNQQFICSEFVGKALKLQWVDDTTTPKEIDKYLRSMYGNS